MAPQPKNATENLLQLLDAAEARLREARERIGEAEALLAIMREKLERGS